MPFRWPVAKTLRSFTAAAAVSLVLALAPGIVSKPADAATVPPRVEAHSEEFDIVGIAEKDTLTLYLDRYGTSQPVDRATIEVRIGKETLTAKERGNGVYWLNSKAIREVGRHTVAFTVSADGVDDLLGGPLVVKDPADNVEAGVNGRSPGWAFVLLPAGIAIGLLGERWRVRRRAAARPTRPVAAHSHLPNIRPDSEEPEAGNAVAGTVAAAAAATATAAATVTAMLALVVFGTGDARAAPAGPGHSHGEGGVSVDVGGAVLPPDSPRRLPDGSLFVPMPSQRLLGTRTVMTEVKEKARTVRVVGRVTPDPGASGKIQSTLSGRIDFVDSGLPMVGQRVTRGQPLAAVIPIVNPIDRGNIQVHLSQLNDEILDLEHRLIDAGRPDRSIPQGEINLLRNELEMLTRRRSSIALVVGDRETVRAALRSPIDGVIAISNAVAGQMVEARDVLFEVVDPRRLWVEAAAFDFNLVDNIDSATAMTGTGQSIALSYLSRGPKLRQQAILLNFRIDTPDERLIVGSAVRVLIQTRRKQSGILLPSAAVVRNGAGQAMVWERLSSERFVPVMVMTEPVDGDTILVLNGLEPGRRIVVEGAALLNQVR